MWVFAWAVCMHVVRGVGRMMTALDDPGDTRRVCAVARPGYYDLRPVL